MEYEINGGNFPFVELTLNRGESVITTSGDMLSMDSSVQMSTNMSGGLMGGLMRAVSGASIFMTTFTANQNDSQLTFTAHVPGEIKVVELRDSSIYCHRHSFLFAQGEIDVQPYLRNRLFSGITGGFLLQEVKGTGTVFLEVGGSALKRTLAAGEVLFANVGHVAIFDSTVDYSVQTAPGLSNLLFSGDGLLARLEGPGDVYLQSMSVVGLANAVAPYLPENKE